MIKKIKKIKKTLQKLLWWNIGMMLPLSAYGAIGTTPISQSVGDALGAFVASGNAPAVLVDVNNNLNALADQNTRNRQLYNLAPELNAALTQMSQLAFVRGLHRVNHRFDEFGTPSGYVAGDTPISPDSAIWMRAQGTSAKQQIKGEFAGFHGDVGGVEIGIERTFDRQNKVGADLSFLSIGIDPRDFGISEHDIESFQTEVYGNYDFEALPVYLEGNLSAAFNRYHSRRHIISGGATRDSKSSYHGWQGGARVELGYMWGVEKLKITPVAGLTYMHTHYDAYKETSADSLNLRVKLDDTNLLRSSIGFRSVYSGGQYGEVTVMPAVYVLWSHDLHREKSDAEANFVAGGPSFVLKGANPKRDSIEAGFHITLYNGHGFNYSTNYHYERRRDFHSNSVWLKMQYEWV